MPDSIDASGFPGAEPGRRQIRELIGRFLIEPGLISPVLLLVFLKYSFKRLAPLTFCQPPLPMRFEIPFSVPNDLLLCADSRVKAVEEALVVLPVRSTDP